MVLVLAALAMAVPLASPAAVAQDTSAADAAPAVDLADLTPAERAELLSRLSDEQVRDLMLSYIAATAAARSAPPPVIDTLSEEMGKFREGFARRLSHFGELAALPGFWSERLQQGRGPDHPWLVAGLFIVITLIAYGMQRLYRYGARRIYDGLSVAGDAAPLERIGRLVARLVLDTIGVAVFAITVLIVFFILYEGHEPTRMTVLTLLTALVVVNMVSAISRFFFSPYQPGLRVVPFDDAAALAAHRWVMAATIVITFGLMVTGLLGDLGANAQTVALLLNLVGLLAVIILVAGAIRLRKPVAAALTANAARDGYQHRLLNVVASFWYVAFIAYVVFLLVLGIYRSVTGGAMASHPGLLSLLIVIMLPAADFFLRALIDHIFPGREDATGVARQHDVLPVFKRAIRAFLIVLGLFLIGAAWGVDFFALGRGSVGEEFMRALVDIALTILVAYVVWGVIKASLSRHMAPQKGEGEHGADEGGGAAVSRLQSVMPLILSFVQISLAVIVVMIILSSLGVDIGPLLAGAGVVGLAVGFGAQSLVRDVVSGLFFLMDDAFRKGEYVDIGSVKGTVEGINIRSLVLRHHLGVLHTVPYGEIQHLSNFSRDWVIVKMEFRVPTDTDINKVKKLFKQIGVDMMAHEEFGKDFLEPFKSQGVKSIEDSFIIVRGKFMSKPGKQFVIRKELFNRVQKAFQENGIEFAHRKVTVQLPDDLKLSGDDAQKIAQAAGAAVLAAEEAEAQEKGTAPAG